MKGVYLLRTLVLNLLILFAQKEAHAQKPAADSSFKPGGKLWGLTFGDYYYKAHSDPQNRGIGQYSAIEKGRNAFQFRRLYLGYNYDITQKFAAELLLAAEDNVVNSSGVTTGDLLGDNKLAFFIKLANIRWKNIWKGTDLVVGEAITPAFPLVIDPIWGYRSIEKTVSDYRRTPSYDLGVTLQGKFDPEIGNFGYDLMVGNGSQARPENDKFKWFYGDVYAKFLEKRLVIDIYADYQRMNWTSDFHHSRNMVKGFIAYNSPAFTIGAEAFVNYLKDDIIGHNGSVADTLDATANAISLFARGTVIRDKLAFFARVDHFNPNKKYDHSYTSYQGLSPAYEPNNKELFITAGLDFSPISHVHFMPNIYYNRYTPQQESPPANEQDHDLVYRITFYYVYGR